MLLILLGLAATMLASEPAGQKTVGRAAESPPVIITQPVSISDACPGSTQILFIIAAGSSLNYQWYRGTPPSGIPIAGATGPIFSLAEMTSENAGSYYAVVSNELGQATSLPAYLSIVSNLIPGKHNTIPITACINYNPDKLSFTTATSGGKPPYSWQWQLGPTAEGPWTPIEGATEPVYDPSNLMAAGEFGFRCMITDECGTSVQTIPKMITIVPDPSVIVSGGGIVCQNSASVLLGAVTGGTGSISYQWQYSLNGLDTWILIPGATSPEYSIPTSQPGLFYIRVHIDASGSACNKPNSAPVAVFVVPLPVLTCPDNIIASNNEGSGYGTVSFEATANGNPPLLITYFAGENIISSPYDFPIGTTVVQVTARNECGIDTNSFSVNITDTTPPTFTVPEKLFLLCVENIAKASYQPSGASLELICQDYYLFHQGEQLFDLDTGLFMDNDTGTCEFQIKWQISLAGEIIVAGAGQPSLNEDFELQASDDNGTTYEIAWWISDCSGNESNGIIGQIKVRPRPEIIINQP
jgi:hypothetical protein